ncbi:MAG: pyridoxal 5'-phosphate synthase lyase subunit PdxS [Methanomassiliicoccales archaeon]|nr:MAG: pyridoxal 5'-phosphate synthase lyase subunit PdxS [Methanomassiliicoccales archaeon]
MPLNLDLKTLRFGTELLKRGFAKMQKGGVIMDVTNAEQALIAEEAGAVAVMALERVPADIRTAGGVARMADPLKVKEIIDKVSIPVMAKARIGHFVEAQALQSLGADMLDESEVLTPGDPFYHIDKRKFDVPFVCGARSLGEAARRIFEGAAMIRTKGEAGTGNVIEAVRHQRLITRAIEDLKAMNDDEMKRLAATYSGSYGSLLRDVRKVGQDDPKIADTDLVFGELSLGDVAIGLYEVLLEIKEKSRLPVVNFAAGGIATPADAALMMQLGCDGIFVGSGVFKSDNPKERGRAIVKATANFDDPSVIAEVSKGLGEAMKGLEISEIPADQRLQERGW